MEISTSHPFSVSFSPSFFTKPIKDENQFFLEHTDKGVSIGVRDSAESSCPKVAEEIAEAGRRLFDEIKTNGAESFAQASLTSLKLRFVDLTFAGNVFALQSLVPRLKETKDAVDPAKMLIDHTTVLAYNSHKLRPLGYRDYCDIVPPDIAFVLGEHQFPAHRSVLCLYEWWAAQSKSGMKDSKLTELPLPDTNPVAFEILLQYLYTGRLELPLPPYESLRQLESELRLILVTHLKDLKVMADFYQLPALGELCHKKLTGLHGALKGLNALPASAALDSIRTIVYPLATQNRQRYIAKNAGIFFSSCPQPLEGQFLERRDGFMPLLINGIEIWANPVILATHSLFFRHCMTRRSMPTPVFPQFPRSFLQLLAHKIQSSSTSIRQDFYGHPWEAWGLGVGPVSTSFDFTKLVVSPPVLVELLKHSPCAEEDFQQLAKIAATAEVTIEGDKWLSYLIDLLNNEKLTPAYPMIVRHFGPLIRDKSLTLEQTTVSWQIVQSTVLSHPYLESLTLDLETINDEKGQCDVGFLINHLPHLKELSLIDVKIDTCERADAEEPGHALQVLNLKNTHISQEAAQFLTHRCKNISKLYMKGNPFDNAHSLASFLKAFHHLQAFSALMLSNVEIQKLKENGIAFPHLVSLLESENFDYLELDDPSELDDATLLILSSQCPALQRISLVSCPSIRPAALHTFLQQHPHLTHLALQSGVSNSTLKLLGKCCPDLIALHLNHCEEITQPAVLEMIALLPHLKLLHIPKNVLANEDVHLLKAKYPNLTTHSK